MNKLKRIKVRFRAWFRKHKLQVGLVMFVIVPLLTTVSFVQILDRTKKKRSKAIEYLVVHYTANLSPGADARANAYYLKRKEGAGTHYCIDDEEIIQCTEENYVAYAVADRRWLGFIPKPWLDNKIKNANSLSFEMCFGGGRNDSLIIDMTARQLGWQLVNKGLDISRIVRHHDVTGKQCPKFNYNVEWNQKAEDIEWAKFKCIVKKYQEYHLEQKRLKKMQLITPIQSLR